MYCACCTSPVAWGPFDLISSGKFLCHVRQPLQSLCQGSNVHGLLLNVPFGSSQELCQTWLFPRAEFGPSQDCMAGMQGPAVSGKDIDAVPGVGLVSDSADSMDVSRRQSVRYTSSVFSHVFMLHATHVQPECTVVS